MNLRRRALAVRFTDKLPNTACSRVRIARTRVGRALVALWCAAAIAPVHTVHANPPPDTERAQVLFEQARQLVAAGRYAEACAMFAESQRLDPAGGTLLNLAVCHESEGKMLAAWAEFHEARVQARQDGRTDREDLAAAHIARLESR